VTKAALSLNQWQATYRQIRNLLWTGVKYVLLQIVISAEKEALTAKAQRVMPVLTPYG
jgi:hypothetical protein